MLQVTAIESQPFFSITLGNIISAVGTVIGVYIAYIKLAGERRKEQQALGEMHTENRMKLDSLLRFQTNQEEINRKRDHAINELKNQTGMLTEITKGFNRRLEMLEDRRRGRDE